MKNTALRQYLQKTAYELLVIEMAGLSTRPILVVGQVPQLDLFDVASRLQHDLGRVVQFNVYEPVEWRDLVKNDPLVSQIVNGPRLQVMPHAKTS